MYEMLKENLERKISPSICFLELRGMLILRGEGRIIIMQKSQGSRQEDIDKNLPTILEEGENA